MTQSSLKDSGFVDLYLGLDYAEIKGFVGGGVQLSPAPEKYRDDIQQLKQRCEEAFIKNEGGEFFISYDDQFYRVTAKKNARNGSNDFVIRQIKKVTRTLDKIKINSHLRNSLNDKSNNGLILIAGPMGSGKTTTAAAILSNRISITGQLGVSIEDPIETLLEGTHGNGRCLQMEVTGAESYATATKKAYRMGATSFLLGEIRDGETAHEVLKASLSMFVVSTIHASSPTDALERYAMFCEEVNANAKANIASTLYIVAYQELRPVIREGIVVGHDVEITGFDIKNSSSSDSIKSKIKSGDFNQLIEIFDQFKY